MCLCVLVCACVCACVCMCVFVCVYKIIHEYVCKCICIHCVCVNMLKFINVWGGGVCVYLYTLNYLSVYVNMIVCIRVYTCVGGGRVCVSIHIKLPFRVC